MKTNSLPGKIKEYDGPTSLKAISEKIAEDAKEQGLEITVEVANAAIRYFFRHAVFNIAKGHFVEIEQLGQFGMTKKKRLALEKKDVLEYERKYRLKRYNNNRKYHLKKFKEKFLTFNAMRRSKGLDEWSFSDYKCVHKMKIPRRIRYDSVLKKK